MAGIAAHADHVQKGLPPNFVNSQSGNGSRCISSKHVLRAFNMSSSSRARITKACLLCCLLALMPPPSVAATHHRRVVEARPYSWPYFGIQQFTFVGSWNNQSYSAEAWLRLICLDDTTHLARIVVSLHSAPFITISPEGVHSLVPASFYLNNGSLPRFWLQSIDDSMAITAEHLINYDGLIKQQEDAAQLILGAKLPAAVPFTLRMEGSERVHMVPRHCGPKQHPLFTGNSVWLGIVDATTVKGTVTSKSSSRIANELLSQPKLAQSSTPDVTATAGALGSSKPSDPATTLLQLLQEQQEEQQQRNAVLTDNMQLMHLLAAQQRKKQLAQQLAAAGLGDVATLTAMLEPLIQQQQGSATQASSSSSASALLAQAASKLNVALSGAADTQASVSNSASRSSSTANVDSLGSSKAQRRLLSRTGQYHAALSSTSVVSSVEGESRGSIDSSEDNVRQQLQTDTHLPLIFGNNSAVHQSSRNGNSANIGTAGLRGSATRSDISSSAVHLDATKQGKALRFLTLQHFQHHRAIGFSGTIMVVTSHTAAELMQSRVLRRAMQRQRLILVLWDLGLEPHASHFMQVPAYNLIRLAAWGSNVHLGFWDLDEYLILPKHRPVSEEIQHGCLSRTFAKEPEAVIPTMWVASNTWNATPEVDGWLQHGYWSRAVQSLDYAMWPYTFCDGACKSIISPNTDLMFQVHQHARPPPRAPLWPVSWRCSYMLHFYQLWGQRMPWLMSKMGYQPIQSQKATPGIPLIMEDVLPQPSLQHLAKMAQLYQDIISSNPELGHPVAKPDDWLGNR